MRLSPDKRNIWMIALAFLGIMGFVSACGIRSAKPTISVIIKEPTTVLPDTTATPAEMPESLATPAPQPTAPLILEPAGVAYTIPLHVQHKTQDQVVLMFELDRARDGRVYWWTKESSLQYANYLAFSGAQSKHLISLSGLDAGQSYQLAVALPGDDGLDRLPTFMDKIWGPIEVTTLKEGFFPLTIGVFGDSGFGEDITVDLATQLSQHEPDIVIHTGDLVYLAYQEGSPEAAYQRKWYQTLSSLLQSSVIYPVVGNHEYDGDASVQGIPYYFEVFPKLESLDGGWLEAPEAVRREWYALEFDTLQVLFLNSQQLYGGDARQEQDAWLNSRLVDDRFDVTVVVFHVPPFTSGRHRLDGAAAISSWVPAFEASNVVLVLSGHDHNYERLTRDGITYVISGGGSTLLYPLEEKRSESQSFAARTHYVLLELDLDRVQLNAFDLNGEMFDSAIVILPD